MGLCGRAASASRPRLVLAGEGVETLELLILKAVSLGELHGYGILALDPKLRSPSPTS